MAETLTSPITHAAAFRPAAETPTEVELHVTGSLPPELRGTLFRNGPARWEAGGFRAAHLFDGDGMVARFAIDGGRVRFSSRYVRTPKFLAEEAGHGRNIRGLYTESRQWRRNVGRYPADPANTHIVSHGGRLLALSDVGRPWEIDAEDLSTIGRCTFHGRLPRLTRFSPHPKIDARTGDLYNFGLDLNPRWAPKLPAALRCYRVDPSGRLHHEAVVPLDHVLIQHDFAITEHYLVFALAPITVDPVQAALALLGIGGTTGDSANYRPEQGMKIVLVPRGGGKQRVIECDPFVYVHVNNAYEDGNDVVLDVVRHPSFDLLSTEIKNFRGGLPRAGWPARLRITQSGRVAVEDLDVESVEFPMHDERLTGRNYRHSYFAHFDPDDDAAIVKVDLKTGKQRSHTFGNGEFAGEPVFVPRSRRAAEDDGWLLTVTYLAEEHRTALVVLDATDPEREPVAVARIDGHFFPGFHGSFTDQVA